MDSLNFRKTQARKTMELLIEEEEDTSAPRQKRKRTSYQEYNYFNQEYWYGTPARSRVKNQEFMRLNNNSINSNVSSCAKSIATSRSKSMKSLLTRSTVFEGANKQYPVQHQQKSLRKRKEQVMELKANLQNLGRRVRYLTGMCEIQKKKNMKKELSLAETLRRFIKEQYHSRCLARSRRGSEDSPVLKSICLASKAVNKSSLSTANKVK